MNTKLVSLVVLLVCLLGFSLADNDEARLLLHIQRVQSESTIEHEFASRSDPDSSSFRKFLTVPQLIQLVRAEDTSVSAVKEFLLEIGAQNVTLLATQDIIQCFLRSPAQLQHFTNFVGGVQKPSAPRTAAKIPSVLQKHVRFGVLIWRRSTTSQNDLKIESLFARGEKKATEPGMTQTPFTIWSRYKVPTNMTPFPHNFSQGVAEFETEWFLDSDMRTFFSTYKMPNVSIPVMGPNKYGGDDAVEGSLDLEYMAAMSNGRLTTWWLAQSEQSNFPGAIDFSKWCADVLVLKPTFPLVVSISWGMGVQRYMFEESIMVADNDAFRKMGLVGVSIFAASGDSGPGNRGGVFNCQTFVPSWPASSSYLTSVGATYANTASGAEIAVSWSGGGFSTTFSRPSWQNAAVVKYFEVAKSSLPNITFYNASGRGYPDVAALGTNYNIFVNGGWQPVSGTSCASPVFAGIIGRIVAERLTHGKSPLGFLNPTLYKHGKVGFDVTQGASVDKNCIPFIPLPGFPAAHGWDAVTGLGTPDYVFLRELLLQ